MSLSFQSLVLIYLINYGALCLSNLADHELAFSIRGNLLPADQSVSRFSLQNLEELWNNVSEVLNINDDEKQALLSDFLLQFYKVCCIAYTDRFIS